MTAREEAAEAYTNQERYRQYRSVIERLNYRTHFLAGWDAAVEAAAKSDGVQS